MFKRTRLSAAVTIACGGALITLGAAAQTSTQTADKQQLDRVTVTGSNISRTDAETPSPIQVITAEDLKKSGYTSAQQVIQGLTANGQGTLSQSFSGAFASGASGVALRGLNVGATLVLIDGHRMAPYPVGDDGQRSFVDIANIPFDSIERIEILKDGASAVYGSDAIAGVVNIILKRSFVGKTITADVGTSTKGDGNTYHLAGTFGFGDLDVDGHNFYVSAEVRKQNEIKFTDRGGIFTQTDFTSTGGYNLTPGVPAPANPLVGGLPRSGTGYVTNSAGAIVGFMPGCDATKLAAGQCTYHDTWDQIQPPTENYNLVGRYTQNINADWQVSLQGSYFESKSSQVSGPSRAFAGGYQGVTSGPGVVPAILPLIPPTTISSTNPSYPAGTGLTSGLLRYTFLDLGGTVTDTDSKATRLIADVKGTAGAWNIDGSVGYTQVLLDLTGRNYVNPANLQSALDSTTNPYLVGQANSASVLGFIAPTLTTRDTSKLSFAHVGAGRDVGTLAGGPLSVAFGADYVYRTQNSVAPADVANGLTPNFSNNYTVGEQRVASVYGEVVAPVLKQLEVEGAVRYDHYNLSGGKASPKVGAKYTPFKELAFRGTVSRGFRAPSPSENGSAGQTFFAGTSNDEVLCPKGDPTAAGTFPSQCGVNAATIQGTNPKLKPETSQSFTLGAIFEPIPDFNASLDFYSIKIKDQIVAGSSQTAVRGTNFTPIEQVQADGSTALVAPPSAPIAFYQVAYVNANTTETNGVDLGLQYKHRFEGIGEVKSDFTWSYTHKYDLTIDGTTYHLAGTHGPFFFSGDTGNPRSRIQWANTIAHGPLQLTGTINYISSFKVTDPSAVAFTSESQAQDTCLGALANSGGAASTAYLGVLADGVVPGNVSCRVGSFTTFDVTGRYDINKQLNVHLSILNLFNRSAPLDWATYGGALGAVPWNPSLHTQGAIGRYFNVGATYAF